jgi:uncharacterized metal-binding protein
MVRSGPAETALAVGIDLDRRPYEALICPAAAGARAGPLNAASAYQPGRDPVLAFDHRIS